eukprot:Lithocolla_globosa_v1_NODE_210_length_5154_cov_15.452834.p4 type:complete len:126 gc:universal NODE_210_length_5154_cov_15.452834:3844-3467(-)
MRICTGNFWSSRSSRRQHVDLTSRKRKQPQDRIWLPRDSCRAKILQEHIAGYDMDSLILPLSNSHKQPPRTYQCADSPWHGHPLTTATHTDMLPQRHQTFLTPVHFFHHCLGQLYKVEQENHRAC